MNPGKLVDPVLVYGPADNLRVGPVVPAVAGASRSSRSRTTAADFAEAVGRCVGVGKCRVTQGSGQVMCPSFQVLGEEQHSTRGRARLLFEMLDGGVVTDGWRSTEVHDALDMCLSCKGCKSDCPVGVDMATYKAEFLSHHYKGRLRPVAAYSMGLIGKTARLGRTVPAAGQPRRRGRVRWSSGWPASPPSAQRRPSRSRASARGSRSGRGSTPASPGSSCSPTPSPSPSTSSRASPPARCSSRRASRWCCRSGQVCCGRPLFDYGFLDEARRTYLRTLRTLRGRDRRRHAGRRARPELLRVVPRRAGRRCCPTTPAARRLSRQTFTLAEFLDRYGDDWQPPQLEGTVLLQTHCHEHAVLDAGAQLRVLARTGAAVEPSGAGCCGLAGSWGFEREHYARRLDGDR